MAQIIEFIKTNWHALAPLLYVIVDTIIYFIPSLKANGIWQQIEMFLKKESDTPPPSA